MIRHSAKPAPETMSECYRDFRSIKDGLRDDLGLLGMDVADNPSKVPCRILPAPRLRYKSRAAEIRDGQWRPDEFRFVKKPLEVYEGNKIISHFILVYHIFQCLPLEIQMSHETVQILFVNLGLTWFVRLEI